MQPNNDNSTGFSPVPNLQSQRPQMDNSQNNTEWEQNNIIANRQAQGLPSYAPAPSFGGAQPSSDILTSYTTGPVPIPPPQQMPMQGASYGSLSPAGGYPVQSFGGSRPYPNAPMQNPFLDGRTPDPQTANGGIYDRVQALQNLQSRQALQNAAIMQQAQRRDRSPIAFFQRFAAGATGRPQPMSARQQAASSIAAQNALSNQNQELLLKAIGAGQGDWKDRADLQHQLAGDYNTGLNNRMNYDQQMYGHDVTDRGNQLTYGSNMYGHDVTREGNQLTAGNTARRNSDLAQHEANADALANRGQQIGVDQSNRDFGLRKQLQGQAQSNIEAQRRYQAQKDAAEQAYAAGQNGAKGTVYNKYNFPVACPPDSLARPTAPQQNPMDSIARFFGIGGGSSAQAPQQPQLPQPTKSNKTLDKTTAQAYLERYGSKEAARAAATAAGWRLN